LRFQKTEGKRADREWGRKEGGPVGEMGGEVRGLKLVGRKMGKNR